MTADFDGHIPAEEDPESALREVIAHLGGRSTGDLEQEVHAEMAFLLCPKCRSLWADNPLGVRKRPTHATAFLH